LLVIYQNLDYNPADGLCFGSISTPVIGLLEFVLRSAELAHFLHNKQMLMAPFFVVFVNLLIQIHRVPIHKSNKV